MEDSKLNNFEAISIVLTVFVSYTLVSVLKTLIDDTKSALIINLIYIGIIGILLTLLIIRLMSKFPNSDIIDISEFLGGDVFKKTIGIIFISYFIFTSSILLRNFSECLKIVYYPMTNVLFIILAFIIAISVVSRLRFSSFAKVNSFILPIFLASVFFVFLANFNNFSFSNIFPILGSGAINIFVYGIGNLFAFAGIGIIYFLPPMLKDNSNIKKVSLISVSIGIIYFIITSITVLFLFSHSVEIDQISILYSITRNIEFTGFLERLDAAFVLIWILQVVCFVTLNIHFSMNIFKKITKIKDTNPIAIPLTIITFSIALLPKNYAISYFLESVIYKYLNISIIFVLGISILIIANLKLRKKEKLNNEKIN